MLETLDVELIVALAATGQLAKAAAQVEMHHATAFRRLNALEARWGTRLFDRHPAGYVPTEAGRAALVRAQDVRQRLLALEGELRNHDTSLKGRVRLTTSDGLATQYLPVHLIRLAQRYPEIQVDVVVDNRLTDLNERDVDVAVRPAKRLVGGRLVGRKAGEMRFALYAAPAYLSAHAPLQPGKLDLSGHSVCGFDASIGYFSAAQWLSRHAKGAEIGFRVNQLSVMQAWAREGGGLAVLPCVLGDQDARLIRVRAPEPAMTVGVWLCTHPHIRSVAKIRAVLDGLFESIQTDAQALFGRE